MFKFYCFIQIKHRKFKKFNKKIKQIINVIVVLHYFFNNFSLNKRFFIKNKIIFVDLIEFLVK